jgi:3-keto-disaccharide hydrolase
MQKSTMKFLGTLSSTCIPSALALLVVVSSPIHAADRDALNSLPLLGRWDLTVHDGDNTYPSWIEVKLSGRNTLVGSYVGQFGSARPVANIEFDKTSGHFHFVVPPQWEHRTNDVVVEGTLKGDALIGSVPNDAGNSVPWEGHRAPALVRDHAPKWGQPVELFNGHDLAGWKPRSANAKNGWQIRDGLLANANPGNDLLTERKFTDFKLRAEFRYPKDANSGIYLRGRYEVQIEDDFGLEPESHLIGGVYGHLTPRVNTAKKPGEWQTLEITLVGRVVNIVLNGEPIIERQSIPGITGGALDSNEEKPGPLLIQGDHGQVEFRKLTLTPAE